MANNIKLSDEQWSYYNGIICTGANKNKMFDFRDKLAVSGPSEITKIHSDGSNGPSSRIGFFITEGSGASAKKASYNFPVEVILAWYEVAKAKLVPQMPTGGSPDCAAELNSIAGDLYQIYQSVGNTTLAAPVMAIGNRLNDVIQKLQSSPAVNDVWEYNPGMKVNPYAQTMIDNKPYHEVSSVQIRFAPFDNNDVEQKYPWYIAITNGYAPMTKKQTGQVNYNGSDIRNKTTVFVKANRLDMFSMLEACERYIRLWEYSMATNAIQSSLQYRQQLMDWMRQNH